MGDESRLDLARIRELIGASVVHRGRRCRLVEVLDDERAVVLEACHRFSELQSGQSGAAMRRVPQRIVVRIFAAGPGSGLSQDFLDLGLLESSGR